jgi:hypothetical protein
MLVDAVEGGRQEIPDSTCSISGAMFAGGEGQPMKLLVLLALTLLLSACMGRSPVERRAEAQNACTRYGFKPGTDQYAQCMMQLDLIMQEQDADRRQALAEGLRRMGENARNNRVTCNTSASVYGNFGNSTTTCY